MAKIDLTGKKALILGIANERSIAWGIAKALAESGATVALTFQNELLEKRVRPLAQSIGADLVHVCDVSKEGHQEALFEKIERTWGSLDILVHSLAYAEKRDLGGRLVDTSLPGFRTAMEISVYSLLSLSRHAERLMPAGGTILTMSYYGAQKVIPNYNVMGLAKAALESAVQYLAHELGPKKIRVHAISAGPVKTLAAAGGISGFRSMLDTIEHKAPLRENISPEDVGALATFLCTDGAKHMSGQTLFVDSGFHVMGM